jgi:hypothetical protein
MVILRAISILEGQKEDKGMMCSITLENDYMLHIIHLSSFYLPKIDVALKIIIEFMIDHYWILIKW